MNALRWTLFTATALAGAAFLALAILGDGFRRSFAASGTRPLVIVLPLAVFLLFLASLLLPGIRPFLHAVAAVDVLLAAGSAWLMQESPFLGGLGLGYAGLWGGYYWLAAWGARVTPPP